MRNRFVELLISLAQKDKNVFLLCNDSGYGVLEPFIKRFPKRYLNVGISEQNMVGIAAGLAKTGKNVFIYTLANFGVVRCLEQIRNDICYQNMNITLVALCCGIHYETQGFTHFGIEDIGCVRSFPNTFIYNPANNMELEECFKASLRQKGFKYFRLEQGIPVRQYVPSKKGKYVLEIDPKKKINIISTGVILEEILKIKEQSNCPPTGIFSIPFITQKIGPEIIPILQNSHYTFVVEEHISQGGLFSVISEIASQLTRHCKIIPLGITHKGISKIGTQQFMRHKNRISSQNILEQIQKISKF